MRNATPWVLSALLLIGAVGVFLLFGGDRVFVAGQDEGVRETAAGARHTDTGATRPAASPIRPTPYAEVESGTETAPSESRGSIDRDHDLHGWVVDPDEQGVAGARVQVTRNEARGINVLDLEYSGAERVIAETTTDREGNFRFRLPRGRPHDLAATANGYARTLVGNRYAGELVVIKLQRGATLKGVVTRAADGSAVADARIRCWRQHDHLPLCRGATNAAGHFEFAGLEPEDIVLELAPPALAPPSWQNLKLLPGQVLEANFALEDGATITGQVVDAVTKAGIAGAQVGEGWTFFRPVTCGPDGRFVMRGVTGKGRPDLHARAAGYGRQAQLLPDPIPEGHELTFSLVRGRTVVGRVTAGDGTPVAGAYVAAVASKHALYTAEIDWPSTRTAADGTFEISGVRKDLRHALWIRKEGLGSALYDLPPRESDEDRVDVGRIVLAAAGSIGGVVVTNAGAAMPDAKLLLKGFNADRFKLWEKGATIAPVLESYVLSALEGRSDDLGRFCFNDLAPGEYKVGVDIGYGEDSGTVSVNLPAGRAITDVRVVFTPKLSIKGRIEDPRGQPVNLAVVDAYLEENGEPATSRTEGCLSTGGDFEVTRLSAGTYTLVARLVDDEKTKTEGIAPAKLAGVAAGATGVRLVLTRALPIKGTVLDAEGKPLKDALVIATDPKLNVQLGHGTTAADGTFTIDAKEGEPVSLEVLSPHYGPGTPDRPMSWGDPRITLPTVRAGQTSVVVNLPAK